ncbi:MAG: hypothetical protein ACLT28_04070, partial [Bifidobacterium longum]
PLAVNSSSGHSRSQSIVAEAGSVSALTSIRIRARASVREVRMPASMSPATFIAGGIPVSGVKIKKRLSYHEGTGCRGQASNEVSLIHGNGSPAFNLTSETEYVPSGPAGCQARGPVAGGIPR